MSLRHSTYKEMLMPKRNEKLREFGRKFWDSTKKLGKRAAKFALAVGLGLSIVFGGCGSKETTKPRFEETGIVITPFDGKLLQDENGNYYMANRLLAGFNKEVGDEQVLAFFKQYNGKITGKIPQLKIYEIEVDEKSLDEAISVAKTLSHVSFAERNYFAELTTTLDNDTYQGDDKDALWWSKVIQLSEAYKYIEENGVHLRSTTVAVLDTSFDLDIPELRNQYVDKRYHHDFGDSDHNVSNDDVFRWFFTGALSPFVHGTKVTGIVAAENNDSFVNGVFYNAKILPLKYLSSYVLKEVLAGTLPQALFTDDFKVSAGLAYVGEVNVELNIRAVNMSFSFKKGLGELDFDVGPLKSLKKAVALLSSKGVIIVAGAGNDNSDSSSYYPCAYPEVICVGSTELKDGVEQRASFSNFSDDINALSIAAPGGNLLVIQTDINPDGTFRQVTGNDSGTSFSSPIVAGAAALLKSIDPTLTPAETLQILRETADDVETDKGTWKRVNAYKAVQKAACLVDEQCGQNNGQTGCSKIVEIKKDSKEYGVIGFYGDYVLIGPYDSYTKYDEYYLVNIKDKTIEEIEWPQEFKFISAHPVKGIWKDHLLLEAKTPSTSTGDHAMILYNFKTKTFTVVGEGMNMSAGHGALVYSSTKVNEWGLKVYDLDGGSEELVRGPFSPYQQLEPKEAVSLRGIATTAFTDLYGPVFLLVNDLNNPNGGWNQVTQNGVVEVVAMHGGIVAFMQDMKLRKYSFDSNVVSDTGIAFPRPTLENIDDWGKIDVWGNKIVYSTSDSTSVFDVTTGAVVDLKLPPLKLGGPKIYKSTIAIRGRLMEWKEPPGYYDQKESWVVTCAVPEK